MDLPQSFMLWHWAVKKTDRLMYEPKIQWAIDANFLREDPFTEKWEVAIDKKEVQFALLQALHNISLLLLIQPGPHGFLHLSYGGQYAKIKSGGIIEILATVSNKDVAATDKLLDLTSRLNHMLDDLRTRYPNLYSTKSRFQCVLQYLDKEPLTPTYPLDEYQNIHGTLAWWKYGSTPTGVKHDPCVAYTYNKPLTLRELKILVYGSSEHQLIFRDLALKNKWSLKTLKKLHPKLPVILDVLNTMASEGFSVWLERFNAFLQSEEMAYADVEASIFA